MVALAFAADLVWAAAFADRMDEFDAVGVAHTKEGWLSQKTAREFAMFDQKTEQPRALGQVRKQVAQLLLEPAVESAATIAPQGLKNANSYNFTGVKVGQGVLVDIAQCLIDTGEQLKGKDDS